MPRAKKVSKMLQFFKRTTGLCSSISYFFMSQTLNIFRPKRSVPDLAQAQRSAAQCGASYPACSVSRLDILRWEKTTHVLTVGGVQRIKITQKERQRSSLLLGVRIY